MNDFETKALQVAQRITGQAGDFYNGTLFLECDASNAALVESALIQALHCGVVVSKATHTEFSFDFV